MKAIQFLFRFVLIASMVMVLLCIYKLVFTDLSGDDATGYLVFMVMYLSCAVTSLLIVRYEEQ